MPVYEYVCAAGHVTKRVTYVYKDAGDKMLCRVCADTNADEYPDFAYLVVNEKGKPVTR
jgi:hypothetical protein